MLITSANFGIQKKMRPLIRYYDTAMCVPTSGIQFKLYSWNGVGTPAFSSGDQVFPESTSEYGVMPNLSMYWGTGTPFAYPFGTDSFAIKFYGRFYVEPDRTSLVFQFAGDCKASLIFNGSTVNIEGSSSVTLHPSDYGFKETASINVSSIDGTWVTFEVRVWGKRSQNGGVVVRYHYGDRDYRILNAGVVNESSGYLSPVELPDVKSFEGSVKRNDTGTYSATFPLVDKTGDEQGYYEDANGYYHYRDSAGDTFAVRLGRLVEIHAGYFINSSSGLTNKTEGFFADNYEYIPRFTGNITAISKSKDSRTVTLTISDFSYRLNNQINENYPDLSSYWGAGYFSEYRQREPNGLKAPIAYDKWPVVSAILDLMVKGGIPVSLFHGNQLYVDNNSDLVTGGRKVVDHGFQLDWNEAYYQETPEKDFNYRPDFGDTLMETIRKYADTYGYELGFDRRGHLYFRPQNNPDIIYDDKDMGNMIPDSDGRFSLAAKLGGATTTTSVKNLGDASYVIQKSGDGVVLLFFNAELGKSYVLSFYARNGGSQTATVRFRMAQKNGTRYDNDPESPWSSDITVNSTSFSRKSVTLSGGIKYSGFVKLEITANYSNPIYITDIQLEEFELTTYTYGGAQVDYRYNGGTAKGI